LFDTIFLQANASFAGMTLRHVSACLTYNIATLTKNDPFWTNVVLQETPKFCQ